jgi:hypothetical protein
MKKFFENVWTVIVLMLCCLIIWYFNEIAGFVILLAVSFPLSILAISNNHDSL